MTICVDVSNIRSKGAVIIAPNIINYLLSRFPASHLILITRLASKIDFSRIDKSFDSRLNNSPNRAPGFTITYKILSGNRYFRFLWMFFLSRKYLKQNECNHLISLGGYYPGRFRPFSIVIQNLLPFSPEALSLYRYSFPLTYIKFLLLRRFTLYSASKSEKVYYFTDKSKKVLNRYGINHHRFHQFENSAIWNPAKSTQNSRNTTNDCKVHSHDTLETSKCFTESFHSSIERSNSFLEPSPYTYHYRSDSIESEHIQGQFVSHSVNYFSKILPSRNEAGENGSNHINNTFEKGTLEKISHSGSNVPDDISKQNSILAPIPQRLDRLNLLYVAELLPYKNHLILFAAVHDLLIEGYKISLTLVGDLHNSYSRKIIDFRNSLRFANEITFLGSCPHEKLLKIYPLYDCLVYPSLVESLGIPIYEAIAFGLPVICSDFIDFIPETDISSVSLFNPLDKDELKNCIKYLYSQKFPKTYTETSSSEISPVLSFPIELTEKV